MDELFDGPEPPEQPYRPAKITRRAARPPPLRTRTMLPPFDRTQRSVCPTNHVRTLTVKRQNRPPARAVAHWRDAPPAAPDPVRDDVQPRQRRRGLVDLRRNRTAAPHGR